MPATRGQVQAPAPQYQDQAEQLAEQYRQLAEQNAEYHRQNLTDAQKQLEESRLEPVHQMADLCIEGRQGPCSWHGGVDG
ncbi:hypothetical protein ACFQ36_02475 [Arthrobacter sp. GCM10027362]|uniref:hypothetical protein n=1 Tax=Arthrobacter sp. GCM10027362 TaxID=3273379 RepID=UPI003628A828